MRKQIIISTMAACAAVLTLSASAQNSPPPSSSTSPDQSTTQSGSDPSRRYGGRMGMGQQETRASKIINAEVKSNQGQTIGTINDIILNPSSGRVDFAVISASSLAGSPSSATSPTPATPAPSSTDTSTSSSSSISGKLVAVPWMLLRPAPSAGAGISSTPSSGQTFTFAGDSTKVQSAPSFDQSNWPDITQYTWRQSVYSHFGMTPGSATGGATSPGGTESSSGRSSTVPYPSSPSSPSDNSSGTPK